MPFNWQLILHKQPQGLNVQKHATISCPHCKNIIAPFQREWNAIGDPRVACPKCAGLVYMPNIFEWEQLTPSDKVERVLHFYLWQNMVWFFPGLIVVFLLRDSIRSLLRGLGILNFFNAEDVWFVLFALVAPVVANIIKHPGFLRQIRDSKIRTRDKSYLEAINRAKFGL